MGSLTSHSFPHSSKHYSTLKMAWSSHPVQALPSSLSAQEIPTPSCLVLNRPVWGWAGFQMRKAGSKIMSPHPAQLPDQTPEFQALAWEWESQGATVSAGRAQAIRVITTYTLSLLLPCGTGSGPDPVGFGSPAWPRDGAHSWNPHPRDQDSSLKDREKSGPLNWERE